MTDQNLLAMPATEAAGEAAMRDWAELLVARARAEGVELTGEGGLLTGLVRQVLQTGLEVEMAEHLGYERHSPSGRGTPNSRNGTTPKTVKTEIGQVNLRVPLSQPARKVAGALAAGCSIERKRSLEFAVEAVRGRAQTMMSCSDQNLDVVFDLAGHAQEAGADYIVVHAPTLHFVSEHDETVYRYYKTISQKVDIAIAFWRAT